MRELKDFFSVEAAKHILDTKKVSLSADTRKYFLRYHNSYSCVSKVYLEKLNGFGVFDDDDHATIYQYKHEVLSEYHHHPHMPHTQVAVIPCNIQFWSSHNAQSKYMKKLDQIYLYKYCKLLSITNLYGKKDN